MEQFRTELFGFNRQDVSRYIQKLSRSAKEFDEVNSGRCTELEAEMEKLNDQLNTMSIELEAAKTALEEKSKAFDRYVSVYTDLCTKISNAVRDSQEAVLDDENI